MPARWYASTHQRAGAWAFPRCAPVACVSTKIMQLFDYPGPIFCIQGWPSRIYTDATCLAALLLHFEGVRKGAQSLAAELADPFGLFHSDEFSRFIKKKLVHHHHNPRLADCLLVAGVSLLVVLPSPVSAFENVVRRRCRDEAIIKRGLRDYGGLAQGCFCLL